MNPSAPAGLSTILAFLALFASVSIARAERERPPANTAAHSLVSPMYVREKLPDGSWKPETYAFGEGSLIDRSGSDASLAELTFEEMCEILAESLLREKYVPTPGVEETKLLIIVSWGKTVPHDGGLNDFSMDGMAQVMNSVGQIRNDIAMRTAPDGSALGATPAEASQMSSFESEMTSLMMMQEMADRARREANDYNARLLGYAPALHQAYGFPTIGPQRGILDDLLAEIETPRYFVILQAYDFQKIWKNKEKELLWMTRFSIRAKGRRFDQELANMSSAASVLFGQKSGKLKRHLRPGRGEMGELEVVGLEDEEAAQPEP